MTISNKNPKSNPKSDKLINTPNNGYKQTNSGSNTILGNSKALHNNAAYNAPYNALEYSDNNQKWLKACGIALGVHAVPLLIAAYWIGPIITPPPEEPAIFIDMAPAAAPPAPPASQQPPSPEQSKPEPKKPEPKKIEPELQKPQQLPNKVTPKVVTPKMITNVTNPAVSLPAQPLQTNNQEAKPDKPQDTKPAQQTEPAKANSTPAPNPSPPALSQPRQDNVQGRATWQGLLLDRLNKYQKYPSIAMSQKQQGVPYVRITMDRNGKVISTSLERGSGFPMLDKEAVALPKRASPLPKPPPDIAGNTIQIVVPVEFFIK